VLSLFIHLAFPLFVSLCDSSCMSESFDLRMIDFVCVKSIGLLICLESDVKIGTATDRIG
jgi:hypothetical protein